MNKLKTSGNLIISHVTQITSVVLLDMYFLLPSFYLLRVTNRMQKCAWLVLCSCASVASRQPPVLTVLCKVSSPINRYLPWGRRPVWGRKLNSQDGQFPRGTIEDTVLCLIIVILGPCATCYLSPNVSARFCACLSPALVGFGCSARAPSPRGWRWSPFPCTTGFGGGGSL